jgi:acetolactate synthase-1/2/3 large subunit
LGLVGDCGAILKAVEQAASGRASKGNAQRAEWMKELRAAEAKAYEKLLPSFKSESTPINPYRVAYEINEFLTDNTVYIGDGGDVVTITATAVEPRKAGNWMDPGPLGTLGVGTSFAMATKFVHPKKEVLCYYGDGSFGMTAWDMETAQRFKLPYMAVIGNNSAMNQIRCGPSSATSTSRNLPSVSAVGASPCASRARFVLLWKRLANGSLAASAPSSISGSISTSTRPAPRRRRCISSG